MLNQMETLMIPYALYPLTYKRAVTIPAGRAHDLSILAYKVVEAVEDAAKWVVRRYKRHVSIGELSRLDDRMLRDIGVSRSEIPVIVEAALDAPQNQRVAPSRATAVRRALEPVIPVAENDNIKRRFSA